MHCECTGLPDHEGNSFILDARQALETNPVGGLAEGIHDLVDRRGERQLTALLDHVQPEVGCLEPEMADNVMKKWLVTLRRRRHHGGADPAPRQLDPEDKCRTG